MTKRHVLKLTHFISTAWFVLSVAYIMVFALRQAKIEWWLIFSLAGHSAVVVFIFLSIYLFAIYRGMARSEKTEREHPLSQQSSYMLLYYVSPLLGGLAGVYAMLGGAVFKEFLLGVAVGTLGSTFLVWIVVDPLISLTEMLLPASRHYRRQRLALAKALREQKQRERHLLLARLENEEKERLGQLRQMLEPLAIRLSDILVSSTGHSQHKQYAAIDMGMKAWQIGRLEGMRLLHRMTMDQYQDTSGDSSGWIDFISRWGDGIGSWKDEPFWIKGRMG